MTDKTGFSIDFNVNPKSGFGPLPDWVAFDLCRAYPISNGNLLLHNTRNGKRAVVKPEVSAALVSCNEFKTLDQHAADIIGRNPSMQGQQDDIRQVLKSMLEGGIMVSAKAISDSLKRKPVDLETDTADQPVVAIITWERPQALKRLLDSVVANCNTQNVRRFYVIDDSRDAEHIRKNQELVDTFSSKLATPLLYFGQEEQQSLLTELAALLPKHENTIRFLADQSGWKDYWTSGLARNIALLLSCGQRLVMMDDDTLCDVYQPRLPKPNILFSDKPREADFFASEEEWEYRRQPLNPDAIGRHMQCLGHSFSDALNILGQNHLKPSGFASSTALQTSELQPDSPILMTECGSMGCPGTSNNTWLPDMAPDSLKLMLGTKTKVTNALKKRLVWSGRNQPHFNPRSNMSQITGFDNRYPLPPYLPILRGEDRLFGNMLDFMFPSGLTLDYPWAVPHLPIPRREWEEKSLDFSAGHSFPMFFVEQIVEQKSKCLASEPADRLATLGAWFSDLATAPNDTLIAQYRHYRLRSASERLQHLESLLSKADSAPEEWRDYLQNGINQLNIDLDAASHIDLPVKGPANSMEGNELICFWKETWVNFAAALNAWPDIWAAAGKIVEKHTPVS